MMGLLRNIAGLTLAVLLGAFAVFNRVSVPINYSPVNTPLSVPLYALILGVFTLGFVTGVAALWLNTATQRQTRRRQRKQIKALEKELAAARPAETPPAPPADFFPSLPPP